MKFNAVGYEVIKQDLSVVFGVLILTHDPLQVTEKKSKPHIQVDIGGGQMKTFAPEEISAMVLTKMKETAEAYLGKKVEKSNAYKIR